MVTITNTIDKDLTLQFKGETYVLPAGVKEKFPTEVAAQWVNIYGFLSIEGTSDKEVEKLAEEITAKEVKPKKKAAKKTTKKESKDSDK